MAITPSFCEQIEKFQCLSSSTAQGLSRDTWHTHVARVHVPKNVSWSLWTLRLNFFEIPPAKDFKITWNHLSRHVRVDIYHQNHCTIFFVVNLQFWHCDPDIPRLRLGVMLLTATAQGSQQNQNKSHSYIYYFIKFTLDQQVKQGSQYQKLELCYRLQ